MYILTEITHSYPSNEMFNQKEVKHSVVALLCIDV